VINDNVDEDNETVVLVMGSLPLNASRDPDVHTSRIIDDDTTYVSFEAGGQTLGEEPPQ
jgi:hypothetical protein